MEALAYCFKPDLSATDMDDGVHPTTISPETEALPLDHIGNTN